MGREETVREFWRPRELPSGQTAKCRSGYRVQSLRFDGQGRQSIPRQGLCRHLLLGTIGESDYRLAYFSAGPFRYGEFARGLIAPERVDFRRAGAPGSLSIPGFPPDGSEQAFENSRLNPGTI